MRVHYKAVTTVLNILQLTKNKNSHKIELGLECHVGGNLSTESFEIR